ncbi:MAG: serine hydrolase [Pararhodobacter sp.]|nr:serine hydrolase [Pararhodobacter sp.]
MLWMAPINRAEATPFAAVVMDARTGEILHATNHDTRLHPASLTKMMTLYVAFEAIQNGEITLDTRVRVSRRASREVPSRLGLREGQTIALRYLIRGAALRSGNDTATAIAEAISGSVEAFAARMNRTAAAIGMTNTNFHNAHGLTQSGHLSTARDMSILGRQLFFDYPQYYNLFSRRTEDAGIATVRNTNWRFLDAYRGADGIKTGFTNAAGYNLTAMAERNGVRVLVTVFGGRSVADRHERVVQLMNRGFRDAPTRAAVRRPPPPDYSSAPRVASAGDTRSAGRVIRLQTAPERSIFPSRRPVPPSEQPAEELSEELLAALQNDITAVLAEVATPAADLTEDQPSAPATETAMAEAAAPDRSPLPPARPDEDHPALIEQDLIVARAVGFSTIDPQEYLELTEGSGAAAPDEDVIATTALLSDLSETLQEGAAADPSEGLTEQSSPSGPTDLAAAPAPETEDAIVNAIAESLLTATAMPVLPPTEELLADIVVEGGLVIIPGLPPIAVDTASLIHADAPATPIFASAEVSSVNSEPVLMATAENTPAPVADTADAPVLDGRIVLTSSDPDTVAEVSAAAPPPMPEIVTRVSTSGGRVWSVDLGLYPSRFDAERTLLRVALSENNTLGSGVRRVGQRSGRFVAGIHSLTQEQAELACLRLSARSQSCEVVHP